MGLSLVHWVIVLAIVVLLFGANRIPNVMGDFAKGIKAFRSGMKDDEPVPNEPASPIAQTISQPAPTNTTIQQEHKVS